MAQDEPFFRPPHGGPECSTPRSARLRERRFAMGYEARTEPPDYTALAQAATEVYLREAVADPSLARARALAHVVEHAPLTLEPETVLVGGEDPFFFNLLLPALQQDGHARDLAPPDALSGRLRDEGFYLGPCFEGHITPGLDDILSQGLSGLRARIDERLAAAEAADDPDYARRRWYQAARESVDAVGRYAQRLRESAAALAEITDDPAFAAELRAAADVLAHVPEQPARTLHEALQAFWTVYVLVTLEMGGCCPGGGLGLGRLDQFLYPYYRRDLEEGRLTRPQALELLELFLLAFRHVDYYTGHQPMTPGSQGSLGGVTPAGLDAGNELTEAFMEASLRIAMPAPYLSLRLHRGLPERGWQAAANYVAGGLGFPIVNDEVLIPAFLKHGRSLEDARDYLCSCCYENTIAGREAFHPNGAYLNLPLVLELALTGGRRLRGDEALGAPTPAPAGLPDFAAVQAAFATQLRFVADRLVALVNTADRSHMARRRYPLMSCLIDDCLARGLDVCAGGARYNLVGCIVAGLPNVVNSLAALRQVVFERGQAGLDELVAALRDDWAGHDALRRQVLAAPKWGNDDPAADDLGTWVTDLLYDTFYWRANGRGGRWQLALYSFIANHHLGRFVGAGPDGRAAGQSLTRNLDPTAGTHRNGPTGLLLSLSSIDYTNFPDGTSVNLSFDPALVATAAGRRKFAGFLKAFVELGVGTMQLSLVDTETLRDAQVNPTKYPHLMVKVAGYSARFIDLPPEEQAELLGRATQRL